MRFEGLSLVMLWRDKIADNQNKLTIRHLYHNTCSTYRNCWTMAGISLYKTLITLTSLQMTWFPKPCQSGFSCYIKKPTAMGLMSKTSKRLLQFLAATNELR